MAQFFQEYWIAGLAFFLGVGGAYSILGLRVKTLISTALSAEMEKLHARIDGRVKVSDFKDFEKRHDREFEMYKRDHEKWAKEVLHGLEIQFGDIKLSLKEIKEDLRTRK